MYRTIKKTGVKNENLIMCDRVYFIVEEISQINEVKHAIKTKFRSLKDAIKGADVDALPKRAY